MLINKNWRMILDGREYACKKFPVSMYQTLIINGKLEDPYYGENQYEALELSRKDCEFICEFVPEGDIFKTDRAMLVFHGVDTLAEISFNGTHILSTDNMFRTYEKDVKDLLVRGKNLISVKISSPLKYAEKKYKERPLYGVEGTIPGYQHMRKAHYSFGWDWGPQLPDMGIWRSVEFVCKNNTVIEDVYFEQNFSDNYRKLTLTVKPAVTFPKGRSPELLTEIKLSDGRSLSARKAVQKNMQVEFRLENPPLWNVNGMGEQPLQEITLTLFDGEKTVDVYNDRIGFRTLTVNRDNDKGKFCFCCNGNEVFAMGANLIPPDQILPNINRDKIETVLRECKDLNFNCVRVWGGGVYPDDYFLSRCDELGFIVWQDFMFACAAYKLTPELAATMEEEFKCNIIRMRNHPCLGLWCGNNEIESMWECWGVPDDPEAQKDYEEIFEKMIPEALQKYDPNRFYWPSSPSSGGSRYGGECFKGSADCDKGDQHFWAVWHSYAPLEEFRKNDFPFCSEFGFESIPSLKTVASFAAKKDLNLCSPVMEAHQKGAQGNEKLLFYIAQMCRMPKSFEETIYATQLVQAESIRLNVEHMRRQRGKCMGSLYWQLNDSNPVISWSAADYFGRPKALYYATKRFYAPIIVSCLEENIKDVQLHVTNDSPQKATGSVDWKLRRNDGSVIKKGQAAFILPPLSTDKAASLDLSHELRSAADKRSCYLEYKAVIGGETISSGTTIFVRPKSFEFLPPDFTLAIEETPSKFILNIKSKAYAKGVFLDLRECDCVFSDNFFDFCGKYTVVIEKESITKQLNASMLKNRLTVMSCFDLQ